MTQRRLHIAAYDIADERRRRAAHRLMRSYASGYQKSVFECLLSPAEREQLLSATEAVLDLDEDRFFIVPLEPCALVSGLGRAVQPTSDGWRYLG